MRTQQHSRGEPSFFCGAPLDPLARRIVPVRLRSKAEEQTVLEFLKRDAYSMLTGCGRRRTGPKSLLAAGVGVFLSYSALAQALPPWVGKYEEAVSLLRGGNLPAATEAFEKLWKANPRQYSLANAVGTALDSAGHHQEATEWYKRAIELNPQFTSAYNNLGLNYAGQKDFARAQEALESATRTDPGNEGAFYNLGLLHLQMDQFRQAVQFFRRAHELKPGDPDPLVRLAYASFRSGERAEGLHAIDALLGLPGDHTKRLATAVQVLNAAGLYREALARVRAAGATSSASARLCYEEADALFHLGDYKQAAAVLLKAEPPEELRLDYHLLLGSAQALSGALPEAVKTLQSAVRIAPNRPEPYCRLAFVFVKGYRDQDAQDVLSAGLGAVPNSPSLLFASGVVSEIAGRYQQAIDYVLRSLEAEPHQPGAWSALGDLYEKVGQYDKSSEAYQTAVSQGAPPETTVNYADVLIRVGRFREAERLLRETLERDPKMEKAYVTLGKLYNRQSRYAKARNALERAIRLDPEDADAHFFLVSSLVHAGNTEEARREADLASRKKQAAWNRERASLLREVLVPASAGTGSETTETAQ
jgi:superkiller protein 3